MTDKGLTRTSQPAGVETKGKERRIGKHCQVRLVSIKGVRLNGGTGQLGQLTASARGVEKIWSRPWGGG